MSALGTWIYDKSSGTGGGGGPAVIPDAPPVTITGAEVREIYNGDFEIDVHWKKDATATAANFRGVAVYLEDPDISSEDQTTLDNTQTLDGTAQLSGQWQPTRKDDSFQTPAALTVPGQRVDRQVRVYLAAFAKAANPKLVRANDTTDTPTPNIVITVPAMAAKYVLGQEYAWNVTGAQVTALDDFDNPAGPQYQLVYNYNKPDPSTPLPPGMQAFGGVEIFFQYDITDPATRVDSGQFLPVNEAGPWRSGAYPIGATGTFRVWFVSRDVDNNQNTIVDGVTPYVDVTITYPPAGEGSTPAVSGFTITNPRHQAQPDGTIYALADAAWVVPDSPRYSQTTFYRIDPLPVRQMVPPIAPEPLDHLTFQEISWPKTAQAWTIAAIASDFDGHAIADPNELPLPVYVPTAVWNIGPPGTGGNGGEYIAGQPGVTGVTITTEQQLNSDGVVMMRHKIVGWTNPTDNGFGGVSIARVFGGDLVNATWWDAAASDTSLTTPWEPAPTARSWDFYFVSRDLQNKRNSILPGYTPKVVHSFTPMEGDVLASRMPTDWFDTSEFAWPDGGDFTTKQIVSSKIFVGSILRVGGGTGTAASSFAGNQNGQIGVFNAQNVLVGWIGQQTTGTPDQPNAHTVYGAWFPELYVGGDNPTNAPLYATNSGAVIVGGFTAPRAGRYPYISIRKDTGLETGRIGAALGYPEGISPADQAYISGAWFREFALGGQTLNDWQVLMTIDSSNPTGSKLQMRNINKFTIDYQQNYPNTAGRPFNAANHLEFGYAAFLTSATPTGSYKFPGLTLYRTGTTHGIDIINRGIILMGPQGKLGAFVTYNGDQNGGDAGTFWCSFTMFSPQNPNTMIVDIEGGSASSGSASMSLRDQAGSMFFSADDTNPALLRQGANTKSGPAFKDVAGIGAQWVGAAGMATTGDIICNSFQNSGDLKFGRYLVAPNGTNVIDNTGHWVGPAISGGTGGVAGSDGQVQYNNGGFMGGDSTFAWDDTYKTLVIQGNIILKSAPTNGFSLAGGDAFNLTEMATGKARIVVDANAIWIGNTVNINQTGDVTVSGAFFATNAGQSFSMRALGGEFRLYDDTAGSIPRIIVTTESTHPGWVFIGASSSTAKIAFDPAGSVSAVNGYWVGPNQVCDGNRNITAFSLAVTPAQVRDDALTLFPHYTLGVRSPGTMYFHSDHRFKFSSAGGYGSAYAIFEVGNDAGTVHFFIDYAGAVHAGPAGFDTTGWIHTTAAVHAVDIVADTGAFKMGTSNLQTVIDTTGQFVGSGGINTAGAITTTGDIKCHQYIGNLGTVVIDNTQQFVGSGGVNVTSGNWIRTSGDLHGANVFADTGAFVCGGTVVINSSKQFVGPSINCSGAIWAGNEVRAFRYDTSSGLQGVSRTFTTGTGLTITVTGGIITSIV